MIFVLNFISKENKGTWTNTDRLIKPLITLRFTTILDNKSTKFNSNGTLVGNELNNLLNARILYIIYWYLTIVWFWSKKKERKEDSRNIITRI